MCLLRLINLTDFYSLSSLFGSERGHLDPAHFTSNCLTAVSKFKFRSWSIQTFFPTLKKPPDVNMNRSPRGLWTVDSGAELVLASHHMAIDAKRSKSDDGTGEAVLIDERELDALLTAPKLVAIEIAKRLSYRDIQSLCQASSAFAKRFCAVTVEEDGPSEEERASAIPEIWQNLLLRDFGISYNANECAIQSQAAREMIAASMMRYYDTNAKSGIANNWEKTEQLSQLYNWIFDSGVEFCSPPRGSFASANVDRLGSLGASSGCVFFSRPAGGDADDSDEDSDEEFILFAVSVVDFLNPGALTSENIKSLGIYSLPLSVSRVDLDEPAVVEPYNSSLIIRFYFPIATAFVLTDRELLSYPSANPISVIDNEFSLFYRVRLRIIVVPMKSDKEIRRFELSKALTEPERADRDRKDFSYFGKFGVVGAVRDQSRPNVVKWTRISADATIRESIAVHRLTEYGLPSLKTGFDWSQDIAWAMYPMAVIKSNPKKADLVINVWLFKNNKSLAAYSLTIPGTLVDVDSRVIQEGLVVRGKHALIQTTFEGPLVVMDVFSGEFSLRKRGRKSDLYFNPSYTTILPINFADLAETVDRFSGPFVAKRQNLAVETNKI